MTDENNQPISWLEYKASQTGKTVEEIRQEMRDRSKLADKSKSGFASMDKDRLKELGKKYGRKKNED